MYEEYVVDGNLNPINKFYRDTCTSYQQILPRHLHILSTNTTATPAHPINKSYSDTCTSYQQILPGHLHILSTNPTATHAHPINKFYYGTAHQEIRS
jgi:hypothetical protein